MQLVALAILLTIGSCAVSAQGYAVPAATYFVDGARGADTNAGTTPGNAFATIAKLQSVIAAGQVGAISGGWVSGCGSSQRYREQFTVPTGAIVTGFGCSPLLDASDSIASGAWTKTGGYTSVYQATVTMANPGGTGFLRAWEDGTGFIQVASLSALDAAPSTYYVAGNGSLTGTTQTLYLHTSDGTDPSTNGRTYDYNARLYGLFAQGAVRVSNIWTRRNLSNNGSFQLGPNSFASDIRADEGTKHNALMAGGSYWRNLTFRNSYYAGQPKIALVLNDNNPADASATIDTYTYIETGEAGSALYGHVNLGGHYGTITVKNITTVGASSSVAGFDSAQMIVDGGTLNASITAGSTTRNVIQNLTIAGQIAIDYAVPVEVSSVTSTGSFTNGNIKIGNSLAIASLSIQNSTCANSRAFDGCLYVGTGAVVSSFTFTNNTLLSPVQSNHIGGPGSANLPTGATINGNTYHYPSGGSPSWLVYRGVTYSLASAPNWASWQGLGFDTTGSRVTP